jgi:O-acetyl-ADP-ribose deacetylase (regulator of RNase III)
VARAGFRAGDVRLTLVGNCLWVAYLAAQHGVGRRNKPLRLDALEQCLARLAEAAVERSATVVMPRIGTGLAGGSWGDVEPLVKTLAERVPVIVYDLKENR